VAINASDIVVVSDLQVAKALDVGIDTLFIVVRGPYEAQQQSKFAKSLRICVDVMADGKVYEQVPCSWLLRAKDKDRQQK
jgi:hypothetical protein